MSRIRQISRDFPPFSDLPMTPAARRRVLLDGIDVVIDVGANEGQYALWLREHGYQGRIVSFEPIPTTYGHLAAQAANDELWEVHNYALGALDGESTMHVARNSVSSSVYLPTDHHRRIDPDAAEILVVEAQMRRLDSLWTSLRCAGERVFLKVDVEGYEDQVLAGAAGSLSGVSVLELELSLTPLYSGGALFQDILPLVLRRGFHIVGLEPNHGDDIVTGQMLMVDAVFSRG